MAKRRRAVLSISPDPTILYWLWDKDGNLLYIGYTCNTLRRFNEHKRTKPWWDEVVKIETKQYPSRSEAQVAEMDAIELGQPRYNHAFMRPIPSSPRFYHPLGREIEELHSALRIQPKENNGPRTR